MAEYSLSGEYLNSRGQSVPRDIFFIIKTRSQCHLFFHVIALKKKRNMVILELSVYVNELVCLDNLMSSILIYTRVGWTSIFSLLFWLKSIFLASENDYSRSDFFLHNLVNFLNSHSFNELSEKIWCVHLVTQYSLLYSTYQ